MTIGIGLWRSSRRWASEILSGVGAYSKTDAVAGHCVGSAFHMGCWVRCWWVALLGFLSCFCVLSACFGGCLLLRACRPWVLCLCLVLACLSWCACLVEQQKIKHTQTHVKNMFQLMQQPRSPARVWELFGRTLCHPKRTGF